MLLMLPCVAAPPAVAAAAAPFRKHRGNIVAIVRAADRPHCPRYARRLPASVRQRRGNQSFPPILHGRWLWWCREILQCITDYCITTTLSKAVERGGGFSFPDPAYGDIQRLIGTLKILGRFPPPFRCLLLLVREPPYIVSRLSLGV